MPLAECAKRVLTKTYDIESMLFADELLIDKWYQHLFPDEADWWTYRSLLTMMVPNDVYGKEEHTNLPEIGRRMGLTHQKVAQMVIKLRELGIVINEEPAQWVPDPNLPPEVTLKYWVEEPVVATTKPFKEVDADPEMVAALTGGDADG